MKTIKPFLALTILAHLLALLVASTALAATGGIDVAEIQQVHLVQRFCIVKAEKGEVVQLFWDKDSLFWGEDGSSVPPSLFFKTAAYNPISFYYQEQGEIKVILEGIHRQSGAN